MTTHNLGGIGWGGGRNYLGFGWGGGGPAGATVAPFNPASYGTAIVSLKRGKNMYTDAVQAAPVALYGDLIQQWRDEREAQGGNLFPYGNQATLANRLKFVPTAWADGTGAAWGDGSRSMAITGLPSINANNCTLIVVGCLMDDYSKAVDGGCFVNVGGATIATAQFLGNNTTVDATTNLQSPDAYYTAAATAALRTPTGVGINYKRSVLTLQSNATGVLIDCNGVDGSNLAAADSNAGTSGAFLDDVRLAGNFPFAFLDRVLIYSPALTGANLAAVQSALLAETSVKSLWPLSYNYIQYVGNSLTEGRGHGATTDAQTYPKQCNALLANPFGWAHLAASGRTTAQLTTAFQADVIARSLGSRTGKQVVIFWEGHNDITAGGLTAAQIYTAYKNFGQACKSAGLLFGFLDIMNAGDFTAGQQAIQAAANNLFATDFPTATGQSLIFAPAGGVTWADFRYSVQSETNLQNVNNATYFSDAPNGVHLTPTGYGIVAAGVKRGLGTVGIS